MVIPTNLSLRSMVAYAARCARRAQSGLAYLAQVRETEYARVVGAAIETAERFARGERVEPAEAYAAQQAAFRLVGAIRCPPAQVAAGAAGAAAAAAHEAVLGWAPIDGGPFADALAAESASAVWDRAAAAALAGCFSRECSLEQAKDRARLDRLGLGRFPELGEAIDPSERGPLGPLWPAGALFRRAQDDGGGDPPGKTEGRDAPKCA